MDKKTLTLTVGGKELVFETGHVARQANGAVMLRSGDTALLSTACASKEGMHGDFLPLRVDYTERFSSAGKTLGGFIKREGRPTERETLVCRLIDRPLRPMFEKGYTNEIQVYTQVFSYDGEQGTEPLAICAASAALVISDIPLIKPVAAVRVGMIEDRFVINPTIEEMKLSKLDLMIAGTEDAILMIEGYCDFLTEEQVLDAIEEGHTAISTICQGLKDWQSQIGKEKNRSTIKLLSDELVQEVESFMIDDLLKAIQIGDKQEREELLDAIKVKVMEKFCPEEGEALHEEIDVKKALKKVSSHHMRQMILDTNKRCDGRNCEEVRAIDIEMSPLPRTHGSTIFTRGETQSISVCTLGSEAMGQRYEDLNEASVRRFYLQYSFPPFSVGEVGRLGAPGRREVGHGKLAERALQSTVPAKEDFPYAIRLEANITESNGSSSMASVCGGCLAMMEAGVPISRPIAGIAMGLILDGERYAILSDILGIEDALGDMDFKITGDANGITAFQLDIKVEGINKKIMEVALNQAKQGRTHILNKMLAACPQSKENLSSYAPKIEIISVNPSKIGVIIGPGGKQIRAITEETGVDIDIDDAGFVSITSVCATGLSKAKDIIINLVSEVEVGKTYKGKVVSIKDFGLFVRIFSQEGLCHISEVDHKRIETLQGLYKEGDDIEVKVLEKNDRGQIRLSRKALLAKL